LHKKSKYNLLQPTFWWLNLLMGSLMLIAGFAGQSAPSLHPFLALLGLIYPILIIVQLLFLLGWILFRNIRFLLPLMVLLISYPNLKTIIGFHCGAGKPTQSDIQLFTYNVKGFSPGKAQPWSPALKTEILDYITDKKADIICMQEYRPSQKLPARFQALIDTGSYYFNNYFGGSSWKKNGLIIASRFPSAGHDYLKLKEGRTFAIFSDLVVQQDTLRLINIHLASIGLSSNDLDFLTSSALENQQHNIPWFRWRKIYHKLKTAFEFHENQIHQIRQCINTSPYPVVLCGDFNDTPASYAYHQASGLLKDTFLGKACSLNATYAGPLPFLRIDYVFIPPQLKTVWYRRHKIHYSDHFALSVGLNFRR